MASLVCGWLNLLSATDDDTAADRDDRGMSATDESHFLRVRSSCISQDNKLRRLAERAHRWRQIPDSSALPATSSGLPVPGRLQARRSIPNCPRRSICSSTSTRPGSQPVESLQHGSTACSRCLANSSRHPHRTKSSWQIVHTHASAATLECTWLDTAVRPVRHDDVRFFNRGRQSCAGSPRQCWRTLVRPEVSQSCVRRRRRLAPNNGRFDCRTAGVGS